MKRIIYVSHDQLNAKYGALKGSNPKEDLVVLVESTRMLTPVFGSKVRLYFLLSSAAHFVKSLKDDGYTVIYQKSATTVDGLKEVLKKYPNLPIFAVTPFPVSAKVRSRSASTGSVNFKFSEPATSRANPRILKA